MTIQREAYVYIGVDLHKDQHISVMVDHYREQIGNYLRFDNRPGAFPEWLEKVKKLANGRGLVFGLEDVHGLGRSLAAFLIGQGHITKFANAYESKRARPSIHKTDYLDALGVARLTASDFLKLPDADLNDLYWALSQTVQYRAGLVEEQTRLKNRLHALLHQALPGYQKFFCEPFGKTALAFWRRYPSADQLREATHEELTAFLFEQSHCALGAKQATAILAAAEHYPTTGAFQPSRDVLVQSAVDSLVTIDRSLEAIRNELRRLVDQTVYRLTDIPGIDVVMAAELISLVGNALRFPNVNKFLAYAGIAPLLSESGKHENRSRSQFGRRDLTALFYRMAAQQLAVHRKTRVPRNPEAKAYYERILGKEANMPKKQQSKSVRRKALLSLVRQQAIRMYKLMRAQALAARAKSLVA